MIKRIKNILNTVSEKYVGTYHNNYFDEDINIYKNPTPSDIGKIRKEDIENISGRFGIRFFVDLKEENVFVWNASGALHEQIINYLNDNGENLDWDYLAGGVLALKDGKYVVDWDSLTFSNSREDVFRAGLLLNLYIRHEVPMRVGEQNDFKGYVLGQVGKGLGNLAGTLANTVARASGIPVLAGLSDILGREVDQRISGLFDPLIRKNAGLKDKVNRNEFFYKDDYIKYQTGKYGYDLDLKADKISISEMQEIRKYIYPAFSKFGYNVKFIGKRTEENVYTFILFPSSSRLPLRDSKRNPIVYALPIDIFQKIFNNESSLVAVYDLMKLYSIEIKDL